MLECIRITRFAALTSPFRSPPPRMLRRPQCLAAISLAAAALVSPLAQAAGESAHDTQSLMREVSQLRTELRQQQDLVLLLRSRLAEAEAAKAWMPWLVLGLGGSVVLAGWLGLRGRKPPREVEQRRGLLPPRDGVDDEPAGPATVFAPSVSGLLNQDSSTGVSQISTHHLPTAMNTEPGSMVLGGAGSLAPAPAAGMAPPVTAAAAKAAERPRLADAPSPANGSLAGSALPATSGVAGVSATPPAASAIPTLSSMAEPPLRPAEMTVAGQPARAVSVEELFDLEQQVDFFLVLGQTESAVDLLVSHIRGTGGNSALPYMKLMEVYRQQGDAESYERTRKRFNQRFNAHAPDWTANLHAGRSLEDYPEVTGRLQRVWSMPLDALAELEALMFRRSRGELFDLPAFREVLLLHAMAVDLHERSPMSASKVDILLPLGEDTGAGNTAPLPHLVSSFLPAATVEPSAASRGLISDWGGLADLGARESTPPPLGGQGGHASGGKAGDLALDLDLSDFAPGPKDYTAPAAFTDLALRGEFASGPKLAANDLPKIKPAKPSA